MENEIGRNLTPKEQLLLLAHKDSIMRERSVVGHDGRSIPLTEELILGSTEGTQDFLVIGWNNTPCGSSIIRLTEEGKQRINEILALQSLRDIICRVLTQAKHSLYTIHAYVGQPFSENQIRRVMQSMVKEGTVILLPISGTEIYALKK